MKKRAADMQVMGILNVTPDSFSDGGSISSPAALIEQVDRMVASGAGIIDVGGESSRPFAEAVSLEEERQRVIPAIKLIRKYHSIPISIDTTKAAIASEALDAGADIINDISGLRFDPDMLPLLRETASKVVVMHMLGTPRDMQIDPVYGDVVADILVFFQERLAWAAANGISRERFIVDPGIGFGKTVAHNLTILRRLREFSVLGCPVLVGHSRKAFIGKTLGLDVDERDIATAAISALCVASGATIVRVHDVAKTVQAVRMAEAIINSP